MPPVGCWTFLTLNSTTTMPGAITAPASWLVAAQPPKPPNISTISAKPTMLSLRMTRRGSRAVLVSHHSAPTIVGTSRTTLRLPAAGGGRRLGRQNLSQRLVARAVGLLRAVGEPQHLVARRQRRRPVRDHDDDRAPRLGALDRGQQRGLAVLVEIGVGFVEHQQERIAVERARQRDALALAAGQRRPAFADPGVVAGRHPQDHVVGAGSARGLQHRLAVRLRRHPRDVLGDGAVEQVDLLRHEADVAAERMSDPIGRARRRRAGRRRAPQARCRPGRGPARSCRRRSDR